MQVEKLKELMEYNPLAGSITLKSSGRLSFTCRGRILPSSYARWKEEKVQVQ